MKKISLENAKIKFMANELHCDSCSKKIKGFVYYDRDNAICEECMHKEEMQKKRTHQK